MCPADPLPERRSEHAAQGEEQVRDAQHLKREEEGLQGRQRHTDKVLSSNASENSLTRMSLVETYVADGEDQVKVEPAEIDAHPGPTAEAVDVGGFGMESRVDEIGAGATLEPGRPRIVVPLRARTRGGYLQEAGSPVSRA